MFHSSNVFITSMPFCPFPAFPFVQSQDSSYIMNPCACLVTADSFNYLTHQATQSPTVLRAACEPFSIHTIYHIYIYTGVFLYILSIFWVYKEDKVMYNPMPPVSFSVMLICVNKASASVTKNRANMMVHMPITPCCTKTHLHAHSYTQACIYKDTRTRNL